jgi:ABC-type transporter Mla MlaB component
MTASPQCSVSLTIRGPLERDDLAGLFARTCALLHSAHPELLCCELEAVAPDAVAVDALARLALAARRGGCSVCLRGACDELHELIAFMGLDDVLRPDPPDPPDPPGARRAPPRRSAPGPAR